jgi:N-acetylglucosaminyldiphosphoundecaprenol N-acetyl-beta-D-mannosaminyltransferase
MRPRNVSRIGIGYALVDSCSFAQAKAAILAYAASEGPPSYVLTPNAQHVVLLNSDVYLRQIYRDADLVVPDGFSLLLAAKIFGLSFPQRVAGVDLFQSLCEGAAEMGLRVFFLGGRPGSADLAANHLKKIYPGLQVGTYCPKFGFEKDPSEMDGIAAAVEGFRPHILFVGLGAPKQEYWIHEHGRNLGVSVCIGIGGGFEMVGGVVRRAPKVLQHLGLEWLFRLCLEPGRMWRRYLIGNSQFLGIIVNQRLRRSLFRLLLHVLKNADFQPEMHDPQAYLEAVQLLSKDASSRPH